MAADAEAGRQLLIQADLCDSFYNQLQATDIAPSTPVQLTLGPEAEESISLSLLGTRCRRFVEIKF